VLLDCNGKWRYLYAIADPRQERECPQMRLAEFINDRLLAPFDVRVTRASAWRQKQRREALAASAVGAERILKLGSLLAPQQAIGQSKVRLGSKFDGGYICLNDFDGITTAFSLGIGQNDDWDVEIAGKGIVVHQFDHSIDRPPHVHPNCHFHKKRIVPADDGTSNAETIAHLVEKYSRSGEVSLILKIDIENDEWQVLAETTRDHLAKFSQIICEYHLFSAVTDDVWYQRALHVLEKLNRDFAVVHVHGNNIVHDNNIAPWADVLSVPFPELLEVTYASRKRYKFEPSQEVFPTWLDAPNDPNKPDMYLGRFVFQSDTATNFSHWLKWAVKRTGS
jgi:hypothetical protein